MVTTTKVEFNQLSKAVTFDVKIESDELSEEEVLDKSHSLALKAFELASTMTMMMQR